MATKTTTKTTSVKAAKPAAPAKKAPAAKKPAAKACCVTKPAPKAEAEQAPAKTATCACAAKKTTACAAKKPAAKAAAPKATRVSFSVRAEVGSKVYLAGCFNGWDPTAKQMTDKDGTGTFTCAVNLPKGKYEYKFVINGIWCADPECTDWTQNDMGTLNSVKIVD